MPKSPQNFWDQKAQKSFFASLKNKPAHEQGEFILDKAKELIHHGKGADHDLLKGAESLMNMYTLKYLNSKDEDKARELLVLIYMQLGEPKKANRFLK